MGKIAKRIERLVDVEGGSEGGRETYRVMIAKPCLISSRIALEGEVVSTVSSVILVVGIVEEVE